MNPVHEQRMDALQRANLVRTERAGLKRRLRNRDESLGLVLANPPEWAHGLRVHDLLCAVRGMGRKKAVKAMLLCRIPEERTLGVLGSAERARLLIFLNDRFPVALKAAAR